MVVILLVQVNSVLLAAFLFALGFLSFFANMSFWLFGLPSLLSSTIEQACTAGLVGAQPWCWNNSH
jgi:hypothetical protein